MSCRSMVTWLDLVLGPFGIKVNGTRQTGFVLGGLDAWDLLGDGTLTGSQKLPRGVPIQQRPKIAAFEPQQALASGIALRFPARDPWWRGVGLGIDAPVDGPPCNGGACGSGGGDAQSRGRWNVCRIPDAQQVLRSASFNRNA
jgi:hypothetical protein